ncbi:MAG: type II secretion system GspH family protein [Phycisphaerae bacterium]|nr:type II secretion system GspH family protein [Phycisphaerae bacterium]
MTRLPSTETKLGSRARGPHRAGAYTLVEMLTVVVVLGILSALVFPAMASYAREVRSSVLRANLKVIQAEITYRTNLSSLGEAPAAVKAYWFGGGIFPKHPGNTFEVPEVETDDDENRVHPASKILKKGAKGAYWYNPIHAVIRARVQDQGSDAATLEFYNYINQSDEAKLKGEKTKKPKGKGKGGKGKGGS